MAPGASSPFTNGESRQQGPAGCSTTDLRRQRHDQRSRRAGPPPAWRVRNRRPCPGCERDRTLRSIHGQRLAFSRTVARHRSHSSTPSGRGVRRLPDRSGPEAVALPVQFDRTRHAEDPHLRADSQACGRACGTLDNGVETAQGTGCSCAPRQPLQNKARVSGKAFRRGLRRCTGRNDDHGGRHRYRGCRPGRLGGRTTRHAFSPAANRPRRSSNRQNESPRLAPKRSRTRGACQRTACRPQWRT